MELLVRVVDKTHRDDPKVDAQLTKRGDVIVAVPDGWAWGTLELANPEWRIIRVPDLPPAEADILTASPIKSDPVLGEPDDKVQPARVFRLDLDALSRRDKTLKDHLDDDARKAALVEATAADVRAVAAATADAVLDEARG